MYTYCGVDIEMHDAPIKFEQNCYDLCYSKTEKLARTSLLSRGDGESTYLDGFVDE